MAKTDPGRFATDDLVITSPQCHKCKHWRGDLTCAAFEKGVPLGILMNAVDHKKPVQGDNGITFEEKD